MKQPLGRGFLLIVCPDDWATCSSWLPALDGLDRHGGQARALVCAGHIVTQPTSLNVQVGALNRVK